MDKVLEQIKDFADKAHGEQQRKYTPERYIVHPIRVMELCAQHGASISMQAAALLHDVLEDTPVREEQLLSFLSTLISDAEAKETVQLVKELTDVYTKSKYPYWNRRKRKRKEAERIEKTSSDSQTIKYADIVDNCKEIVTGDPEFAGTFLWECKLLLRRIPKGNNELYQKAVTTVDRCLAQVPKEFRNYNS